MKNLLISVFIVFLACSSLLPSKAHAQINVLVVEASDASTSRQSQLDNKFVPTANTSIAGTGNFVLSSLGPTGLAALTCIQIQAFDVVFIPITFDSDTTSRNAIRDNPAFSACFPSSERAVVFGYHALEHSQAATGQFLFDALTWVAGGNQVGLLVGLDIRSQQYDFLQSIFPGVEASVLPSIFGFNQITFLTIPPHPIHVNTSDGIQNLGLPTMDDWQQTCHTAWNTLGIGGGGYEDDGFIAVSEGSGGGLGPDVCAIAKEVVEVAVDIKPQSCPNPINTKSKGVIPVAILGTDDIDVNDIDITSLQLVGVSPLRSNIEDVATPVTDRQDVCDCTTDGSDGFDDLTLKFDTQDVVAELGAVNDGDEIPLTLTGNFNDGTAIEGVDCIIIRKKGR